MMMMMMMMMMIERAIDGVGALSISSSSAAPMPDLSPLPDRAQSGMRRAPWTSPGPPTATCTPTRGGWRARRRCPGP
eukprot:COSAG01_NODE_1079_length_11822_cov_4.368762_11_plen_77_part_00